MTRLADLREPAVVGAMGTAAALVLHVRDPRESGSYGWCPLLWATDVPCPGCGGLRAASALTRADVGAAVTNNVLVVALVVVLLVAWLLWIRRRLRGQRDRMLVLSPRAGWAVLAVVAAFGLIRLTPWGAALSPS